ncbi:hypothetical protein ACET3Z_026189 [Daucus carota]
MSGTTGRSCSSISGGALRNHAARGGEANPPPPNTSLEKPSNVQGVQTWVMTGGVNFDSSSNADLPANGGGDVQLGVKQAVVESQKSTRGVREATATNVPAISSSIMALSTTVKGGGFPLQFGSVSPALMQVPHPTSSTPPNMDNQKRDQALYNDYLRAAPVLRQLEGILDKLTPQTFDRLFEQVKQVIIDNAGTLAGVIFLIHDRALMKPAFCKFYADFCYRLSRELPAFSENNEKITFKRLLINKCQEEFERGDSEQEEANKPEEEAETRQSDEEGRKKRILARRRKLGNIILIGELYKKKMLTERIMHECIKKLLIQYQNPDEEDAEILCELMSTIGRMIDHPKAKVHMDAYFDKMAKLSNNMKLSSRVRFMLTDLIDLRKNQWQQRRKVEGPKKIEEVHRDAANARQTQSNWFTGGPSMGISYRRQQPIDYASGGPNISHAAARAAYGAHSELHGGVDAQVSVKPAIMSSQNITRGGPKVPAVNASAVSSSIMAPSTLVKGEGFPLQLGSTSSSWMQLGLRSVGKSVSARTSSAPPNSDEQKQEQARYDFSRAAHVLHQLKGILNKLTPRNFDRLFEQVKQINIDNADTLAGVTFLIYDKALMKPTVCGMYANLCYHLSKELPDFIEDNEKITFKRLLLNKCQEEFERGEREREEANRPEAECETKQSREEREKERIQPLRRRLGNIKLMGELYKKRMLTERIMHECIKKLLGQYQNPDEENVEVLCKLMNTIGEIIDYPRAKVHMDAYFDMMAKLSDNMKLSSRARSMLKDSIELRKNQWQQRRKVEGPKEIEEVHREDASERQAQSIRLTHGSSMGSSYRRQQPTDFAPTGSNTSTSPKTQVAFRALPQLQPGHDVQDFRYNERPPSEKEDFISSISPEAHRQ